MPAWWIPSWLIIRFTHARAANNIFALLYLSSHTQINWTFNYVRGEKLDIQVSIMNIRVFRAKRKDKNVLAIAQNMNNYIQNEIRAKNVAMSMKFNTAFVCQCASIFSSVSERIHEDTVVFHGFLLSQPGCSLGCLFPSWKCTRIFDFDISATWRKADFMNRSARIRRKNMASNQGDAQCPTTRGKKRWKKCRTRFLFLFSFFF